MVDISCFLVSLKSGGFGLNLVNANIVILLDPWWNPAAEQQAVDRVHRIGQKKEVHVYRLIASDTVEEAVRKQQKSKHYVSSSLDHSPGEITTSFKLERLKELFTQGRISMESERQRHGLEPSASQIASQNRKNRKRGRSSRRLEEEEDGSNEEDRSDEGTPNGEGELEDVPNECRPKKEDGERRSQSDTREAKYKKKRKRETAPVQEPPAKKVKQEHR